MPWWVEAILLWLAASTVVAFGLGLVARRLRQRHSDGGHGEPD